MSLDRGGVLDKREYKLVKFALLKVCFVEDARVIEL